MKFVLRVLYESSFLGVALSLTLRHSYLLRNYTYLMSMMSMSVDNCVLLKKDLSEWQFAEPKLLELPLDVIRENYVRRNVKGAIFSEVLPTPLKKDLKLVAYSKDTLINILDMDPVITEKQDFAEFIAGNKILESSTPMAHRYGGHQFGSWAMQLGDGRAHLLGEYINSKGEHWELQLKGSGLTPYSRGGDGRAVLRSSIREFLCSEAMYYLGVPTSRAAALVVSKDLVIRDQFYQGVPELERAAVVLRLAPTWFRFGSLEVLARLDSLELLRTLTDFIIREHFPEINMDSEERYLSLFQAVANSTMDLALQWQSVGFTHGVLNTDNMSILSVTIDYGPFGFMEAYRGEYVPNSSDSDGRYCYDKQLDIAIWNLGKLAQALSGLMDETQKQQMIAIQNQKLVLSQYMLRQMFCRKLGLDSTEMALVDSLLEMMESTGTDFTMCFRQLAEVHLDSLLEPAARKGKWALEMLAAHKDFPLFVKIYREKAAEEGLTEERRREVMYKHNPRYVLRNWMAQSAIKAAEKDDFSEVQLLLEVLSHPFEEQAVAEARGYANPPPTWARNIRVSCSS